MTDVVCAVGDKVDMTVGSQHPTNVLCVLYDDRDVDDGKDARDRIEVPDANCVVRHEVDVSVGSEHPPSVLPVMCDGDADERKGVRGRVEVPDTVCVVRNEVDVTFCFVRHKENAPVTREHSTIVLVVVSDVYTDIKEARGRCGSMAHKAFSLFPSLSLSLFLSLSLCIH